MLAIAPGGARAADLFSLDGFADFSLVRPSDQRSWLDGGLGKMRFGSDDSAGAKVQLTEIATDVRMKPDNDLLAFASLRYEPKQKTAFDVLEAYGRWQPAADGDVAWTVKAGAFFPPISLENEGVGWTSPWTLTPSAINSWVGEELRTIGVEASAEWHVGESAIALTGAAFGWNDPAGTLLTDRGWALDDRPIGLLDHQRLPDALGYDSHRPGPFWQPPYSEIDDAPGWYAGLNWHQADLGQVALYHYDNRADPTARRNGTIAWDTAFTSLGAETYFGDVTVIAQGMIGSTEIDPSPRFRLVTSFSSAFLLVGWTQGDWTLAGRAELFQTRTEINPDDSEHGRALTFDASWRARRWLLLSAEALVVDSTRAQRDDAGEDRRAIENQLQLSARLLF